MEEANDEIIFGAKGRPLGDGVLESVRVEGGGSGCGGGQTERNGTGGEEGRKGGVLLRSCACSGHLAVGCIAA